MFLIIFTKPRIRELGEVDGYRIFMTAETLYLFFIPTLSWSRQYFAEYPSGKIFQLTEDAGKMIRRGEKDRIDAGDILGEAGNSGFYGEQGASGREWGSASHVRKCPYCGFTTTENYNYCPKCAEKLEVID